MKIHSEKLRALIENSQTYEPLNTQALELKQNIIREFAKLIACCSDDELAALVIEYRRLSRTLQITED